MNLTKKEKEARKAIDELKNLIGELVRRYSKKGLQIHYLCSTVVIDENASSKNMRDLIPCTGWWVNSDTFCIKDFWIGGIEKDLEELFLQSHRLH